MNATRGNRNTPSGLCALSDAGECKTHCLVSDGYSDCGDKTTAGHRRSTRHHGKGRRMGGGGALTQVCAALKPGLENTNSSDHFRCNVNVNARKKHVQN